MEHQVKRLITFLIIISSAFTACTKTADIAGIFFSKEPVNKRFSQSMEWNNKHPYREIAVPSDDYFILTMADSHVGGTKNLDKFFNIAQTTKASAVVMAGDLTTGNTEDYDVFEQHLPDQNILPSFLIAGNHDLYFNGWNEFYSRFGSSTYLFTIKTPAATDLFVCLDTGGATLGDKQLEWLRNMLQTLRPNYRHCFVFSHTNLFLFRHTFSTTPLIEELHVLIELFTKYKVDMVINGHDHQQYTEFFGVTRYIVMDALKDALSNAGYFQIRVQNGNISYKFENF
jgi:predicted phosphodiesterase